MSLNARVVRRIFAGAMPLHVASVRRVGRPWMLWCVLMMAIQMVCQTEAQAINKCVVDGQVTYQDVPCEKEREIVVQEPPRKEHNAALHRKLDRLAAQGYGMVQLLPPSVTPSRDKQFEACQTPETKSRNEWDSYRACVDSMWQEKALRKNSESIAALTRLLDDAAKSCGGKLIDYPAVGMSDKTFRNCTIHARFGRATQVVVSEEGGIPLKLYIFPSERASRVYSIDGMITKIRP